MSALAEHNKTSWKGTKESFVTGLNGTTPQELILICSTVPVGLFCYSAFYPIARQRRVLVALEGLSFILPAILFQSNWLYPWGVAYMAAMCIVSTIARCLRTNKPHSKGSTADENEMTNRTSITVFRSGLLYLTCIAILAVDFHFFPRRFVKTEEEGYSLMDLGAASFVIAAGLVSPRARNRPSVTISLKRLLPLLFMGSLRLVAHSGLEYPEHASEYGIHWNFFFTMAFLIFIPLFIPGPTWIVPVLIMSSYQYALSQRDWQNWVVNAPRTCPGVGGALFLPLCHFVASNREGILGCIGYGALYLMSEFVAWKCLWSKNASTWRLIGITGLFFVAWRLLVAVGVVVSRRTTNLSFCAWTLTLTCIQLTVIRLLQPRRVPFLLNVLNRQGLITFIIANLITGMTNLAIDTLQVSDRVAALILILYIALVTGISCSVDYARGKAKKRS